MNGPMTLALAEFEQKSEKASELLKAMSNPFRLRILCQLLGGEMSVGDLQPLVGLSQSALSQHLAKLRAIDLVGTRRDKQTIYYRIDHPAVKQIIQVLADFYCPGLHLPEVEAALAD